MHGFAMTFRARRSVLYMPGANERALEKAKTLEADSLILDLEDSVAPDAKADARARVAAAVKGGGYGKRELAIRINGLDTPWGVEDLKMAAEVNPDAILVPKVARPGDIVTVSRIHAGMGGAADTRMWAMMETPMAIFNVREIASVHQVARLSCLVLGTNDLLKESRALATGGRFAILPWLSMTLLAARAYGLDVLDGVYNDFRDEAGFRAECEQGRALGMDGKTLIHPGQIAVCNALFSPAPEEVEWSHKIIAAFKLPENAAKGVITVEGRMVERLHLAMAQRVADIAEAITAP
jgi:citrate lyase subunit beta/citryl-CoA lyase